MSLELAKEIQQKHLFAFSFNNIAVLLGKKISTNIEDIIEKIVHKNLGGYCFEHNKLLFEALKSLGFDVSISIAKVINKKNINTPKTHRITILQFQGERYLIDAGFGAYTPMTVLKLDVTKNIQKDFHLIQKNDITYVLKFRTHNDFFVLYEFDLLKYTEEDCNQANLYSYTNPNAVFLNNLIISKKFDNQTFSYRNNCYHQISKNTVKEYTKIIDIKDYITLKNIIKTDFNIDLSSNEANILFQKAEQFKRK